MITIKTEVLENDGKVNLKLVYPKNLKNSTDNEKLVASELSRYLNECLLNFVNLEKGEK